MGALDRRLLAWYDRHGRHLPWRETRDPYAILVSEIMLQQTQVDRVVPFFRTWLERFPDWRALAAAQPGELIRAWSGLGYNRRALTLGDLARQVVLHGVPKTVQEWEGLKGIGPYTAAAVTLFSRGTRVMPIDTNIRRVGGRLLLGEPFATTTDDQRLLPLLERLQRGTRRPRDLVQALFDLASLVCRKNPACSDCPLREDCSSCRLFESGRVTIPRRSIPRTAETRRPGKPHPDRIYRGRILKLVGAATPAGPPGNARTGSPLRTGANGSKGLAAGVEIGSLGPRIDPQFTPSDDQPWVEEMVSRMVRDGLLIRKGRRLLLP